MAPGLIIWLLVMSGLLFKISAPPFHFWIPDAYQGSTNPVVLYLSTAPKVAGIFVLWKIYYAQEGYPSSDYLRMLLSGISVMAIVWGSLAALKQNNLKRMFAYSSVAHAGLFLSGFLSVTSIQVGNLLFYFWVYLFSLLSALLLLDYFEKITGSANVNSFKGLGHKMPLAGALFVFIMIALTGLPPTAIFYGKLFIFSGLLGAYAESGTILYLIMFMTGLAGTLFSLFFYLKGPYYMYFKTSEYTVEEFKPNRSVALAFASAIPVLVFFLNPDWLMKLLR
jgi:NADH-quinone oxidoreductase subunit N